MVAWIVGRSFWGVVPSWLREALVYALLVGVAFWAFKVFWLNPHDAQVESDSRIRLLKEITATKEAEWGKKDKVLAQQEKQLEKQGVELAKQDAEVSAKLKRSEAARVELRAVAKQIEVATKKQVEANNAAASNVPADKLDDSIRAISRELPQPTILPPFN